MRIWKKTAAALFVITAAAALGSCSENSTGIGRIQINTDIAGLELSIPYEAQTEQDEPKVDSSAQEPSSISPELPLTGRELSDFVSAGWKLKDSVELDFNGDGITDYVGVQETAEEEDGFYDAEEVFWEYPRILFAIASDGPEQYHLDFQDANLIRTRSEGGVFGDPYLPLTAEANSFTTHAFGGSAWKWSENYTYTYRDGKWYLSMSEKTYGYGWYTTSYKMDDWENGVGIRKERSSDFDEMEKYWDEEDPPYDLEYELRLDDAPTIYQAGTNWWLAPYRVTDWEVKAVETAKGVEISEDKVVLPERGYYNDCDKDGLVYSFSDEENGKYYIAMYHLHDKTLSVLAQETAPITNLKIYKEKLYYSVEMAEDVQYKAIKNGEKMIAKERDTVGLELYRINIDGSKKECIFEYRCPEADAEVMEQRPPYLAFIYEISGDEIVLEVFNGDGAHPVYRMNTDGIGLTHIGQIPRE